MRPLASFASRSIRVALFAGLAGCTATAPDRVAPLHALPPPRSPEAPVAFAAGARTPSVTPPGTDAELPRDASRDPSMGGRLLTADEARKYMVALINRDRASMGLGPVELDEGAPTRAGQAHAEDMAEYGYLGHYGTDGSVPEQRHTLAGGADMVLENASCFVDTKRRKLDPKPVILAEYVEKMESMFFHEVPPNDGHRQNILKPQHRRVGIGVAQPVQTPSELPVPCFAQEFTDVYGTYAPIPKHLAVGAKLHVEATMDASVSSFGVGLARVDGPSPLPPAEANRRRSYLVPSPYQMYWPQGYKTPIPLKVNGQSFAIDVPVSDGARPGMYEVSVWGKLHGKGEYVILGLRTIRVD